MTINVFFVLFKVKLVSFLTHSCELIDKSPYKVRAVPLARGPDRQGGDPGEKHNQYTNARQA